MAFWDTWQDAAPPIVCHVQGAHYGSAWIQMTGSPGSQLHASKRNLDRRRRVKQERAHRQAQHQRGKSRKMRAVKGQRQSQPFDWTIGWRLADAYRLDPLVLPAQAPRWRLCRPRRAAHQARDCDWLSLLKRRCFSLRGQPGLDWRRATACFLLVHHCLNSAVRQALRTRAREMFLRRETILSLHVRVLLLRYCDGLFCPLCDGAGGHCANLLDRRALRVRWYI